LSGDTIELAGSFPGWGAADTLVIAIDPRAWAPPAHAIEHDGRAFAPKHELHVTVVGKALGSQLRAAIAAGGIDEAGLQRAFGAGRWRLRRSGRRVHLRKPAPEAAVESIIEPVALPAMARWHAWLGRALGRALPVPPPHVTLYVRGDAEGIGVPDAATLARLRVGSWKM
jgi:hypothetical protein